MTERSEAQWKALHILDREAWALAVQKDEDERNGAAKAAMPAAQPISTEPITYSKTEIGGFIGTAIRVIARQIKPLFERVEELENRISALEAKSAAALANARRLQ
jgi:hypothetical protein